MARIIVSFIFAIAGAVIFSIAYAQVQAGNFQYIATEKRWMMACACVSTALLLPDLIRPLIKRLRRK